MKIFRLILQLLLIIAVIFFGYHYFTQPELRPCLTIPLKTAFGYAKKTELDENKVNEFLDRLGEQASQVASQGGKLAQNLRAVEASPGAKTKDSLLDTGQYLYCKAVVEQMENNSN
jgi:hypothetical protein